MSTKYWRKWGESLLVIVQQKHAPNNSMMLVSQGIVFTMPDLHSKDLDFLSPTFSPHITG